MLYWIITNKHHTMINIFIFLIGYNLFALLLFTITDGVFIKHNRNLLRIITNVVSAYSLSASYMYYKTRTDNNFMFLKDYVLTISAIYTVILLTSDFILTKIKLLSNTANANDYFKELEATNNSLLTPSIGVKVTNNFLLVSYSYIILECIAKYLYK